MQGWCGYRGAAAQCWIRNIPFMCTTSHAKPLPSTHYSLAVPFGNFPRGNFSRFPIYTIPYPPLSHYNIITAVGHGNNIYFLVAPDPISMLIAHPLIGYAAAASDFLVSPPSRPAMSLEPQRISYKYIYIYRRRYLSQHLVAVDKLGNSSTRPSRPVVVAARGVELRLFSSSVRD